MTVILYVTLITLLVAAFTRLNFFMLKKYDAEHKLQSTVFYSFFFRNSVSSSRPGPDSLLHALFCGEPQLTVSLIVTDHVPHANS